MDGVQTYHHAAKYPTLARTEVAENKLSTPYQYGLPERLRASVTNGYTHTVHSNDTILAPY